MKAAAGSTPHLPATSVAGSTPHLPATSVAGSAPPLPATTVERGELLQHLSRTVYRGRPLHFGRTATNRYDSPAGAYGTLYLADDLATGLMETAFHAHRWHRGGRRSVAWEEVNARMVRAVGVLDELTLADLSAPGAMAAQLGLNLAQLTSRRYLATQRVSTQVHAALRDDGRPAFDGIAYPSRNNYPARCIALFEHARDKVGVIDDIDLPEHADWPRFVRDYGIGIVAPRPP